MAPSHNGEHGLARALNLGALNLGALNLGDRMPDLAVWEILAFGPVSLSPEGFAGLLDQSDDSCSISPFSESASGRRSRMASARKCSRLRKGSSSISAAAAWARW